MGRIIEFAYQRPIIFVGLLVAVAIASLAPLPVAARYEWDNVRLKLTVGQRFRYGITSQFVTFGFVALLFIDWLNHLPVTMAFVKLSYAPVATTVAMMLLIYTNRIVSTISLNTICDEAFLTQ